MRNSSSNLKRYARQMINSINLKSNGSYGSVISSRYNIQKLSEESELHGIEKIFLLVHVTAV